MALTRTAPAKINLGLHVLRRRADGFHDIETVLYRIGWADRLTAEPAPTLEMTCSDPALPTDARNLCMQAAQRLADRFDVRAGARLHLDKEVPYGAGLGGGSSDAAATLQLLDALWDLDDTDDALHDVAAAVGSDVPFFLGPRAAYATGRGTTLTPLPVSEGPHPHRLPYAVVVAVPPVAVPTGAAYAKVTPQADNRPDLRAIVASGNLERWRDTLTNDFQAPVIEDYPEVGRALRMLRDQGAAYAALSGSGSAVFGVFEDARDAEAAGQAAEARGLRTYVEHAPDDQDAALEEGKGKENGADES